LTQFSTRLILFAGLLFITSLVIYRTGMAGPLFFDDRPALTANELVKIDGSVFDEWRTAALSSNSGKLRRPISMLSFTANYVVSGNFSPASVKAVNLSIHLAIAVLLYYLFQVVLASLSPGAGANTCRLLALTAAGLWLLHPLNVSTVLYAVQRMAQLSALFVVAGLLVFMHYRQRWAQTGAAVGDVLAAGLWLFLFTALAVLSKESGALLPWFIVVLEVCIFRGAWAGRPNQRLQSTGWLVLLLPFALVGIILALSPDSLIGGYARREFTLEERLLTQPRLLWRYLGWIVLPNINDMGFQHDDIPLSTSLLAPVTTMLALVGWLLLAIVAFLLRRRFPLLLLAVMFFLVGHSMESTLIPLEMVYEHRNYLPSTLVCLAVAAVLVVPASLSSRLSVWYPVSGAIAILCLLLFVRVSAWSNELTLSRTNLAQHPESSRSNYFYANALLRHYRRADERGLDERERSEALLLSRHYFERMYQTNNRDVAAMVMLYYLDSTYFTQLRDQVDWLEKLDELLATRTLQPSDWNALGLLFELLGEGNDVPAQGRVLDLLDRLAARYPGSPSVLRYRYEYLAAMNAEPAQLLPLLRQAQALAPGASWIYAALLHEQAREQDVAAMYESARDWLRYDPQRYRINQIKTLFSVAEPLAEASHE
jgi:hypothetical protein